MSTFFASCQLLFGHDNTPVQPCSKNCFSQPLRRNDFYSTEHGISGTCGRHGRRRGSRDARSDGRPGHAGSRAGNGGPFAAAGVGVQACGRREGSARGRRSTPCARLAEVAGPWQRVVVLGKRRGVVRFYGPTDYGPGMRTRLLLPPPVALRAAARLRAGLSLAGPLARPAYPSARLLRGMPAAVRTAVTAARSAQIGRCAPACAHDATAPTPRDGARVGAALLMGADAS